MKMRKLLLTAAIVLGISSARTQVTFFDDINYGGEEWNVQSGENKSRLNDYNSSPWGYLVGQCVSGPCNWRVSSIKIPQGQSVTLYDGFNYTGNSITFTTDQPNLVNVGWNDRASSIKVQGNAQPQRQQQQRCGGNIVFLNRTGRTVHLYGAKVSKYQASSIYMCSYYISSIAPGAAWTVTVPEGQALNFSIYERGCEGGYILSSGVYQDCQAVGQYHTIDF